jgi:hypothetical protein
LWNSYARIVEALPNGKLPDPGHSSPAARTAPDRGSIQANWALFNYVAVESDDYGTLYKIGITNLSAEKRFPAADLARIRIVKT